ncbi:glutaminase [Roseofilum casamattae]|uniref:glutaminase n=1 Tax=Roseofilum casamattae BLCC-M143 TaxID=3022442 RepID=A0ABT7BVF3_9CYAN|nr:glutaminase [Roseofilum casamattae]MDJ1183177.1 glutaminase [Roseofilum casamattae BLCC-M143]
MIDLSRIEQWINEVLALHSTGNCTGTLPSYIPELARVNPQQLSISIQCLDGRNSSWNAPDRPLPLMSAIKPFILLYVLEEFGTVEVEKMVGTLPSQMPYNSLEQLEIDEGFPRNPMINSGAIALCSTLPGESAAQKCDRFREWLNEYGSVRLTLNRQLLASVESLPNLRNRALTEKLAESGYLRSSETIALDTYQQVCCLSGTLAELSQLGLGLVAPQGRVNPVHQEWVIRLIKTCGLYEYSEQFAIEIGLPTKSGVSGVLLSLVSEWGAIAIYSPLLDAIGNSVMGLALLRRITQAGFTQRESQWTNLT